MLVHITNTIYEKTIAFLDSYIVRISAYVLLNYSKDFVESVELNRREFSIIDIKKCMGIGKFICTVLIKDALQDFTKHFATPSYMEIM